MSKSDITAREILEEVFNIGRHKEAGGLTDKDLLFTEATKAIQSLILQARIEETCKAIGRLQALLMYGNKSESHLEKTIDLYESELKAINSIDNDVGEASPREDRK